MTSRRTDPVEIMDILVFREGAFRTTSLPVIREVLLEVRLDGRRMAAIACTGEHAEELAVGFLRSEGRIGRAGDIGRIEQMPDGPPDPAWPGEVLTVEITSVGGTAAAEETTGGDTITSSGGRSGRRRPAGPILKAGMPTIPPEKVLRLVDDLVEACVLHERTRGVHGAALADPDGLLAVREDIGRHNALDMLSGYALLNGIDCSEKFLVRTGRASVEIVSKAIVMGIPILLSLGVPTTEAVRSAERAGITLVGRIRKRSMNIYSHDERIGRTT
ncbi:MAG TPA: formate dehydrogenase accessory sulfurtransferase FdhD [Syntrophales bacterium]|nr:formate dehydrogenase accessory sulfurtransferase FdhD [Syntrophales bacterium]